MQAAQLRGGAGLAVVKTAGRTIGYQRSAETLSHLTAGKISDGTLQRLAKAEVSKGRVELFSTGWPTAAQTTRGPSQSA